MADLTLHDMDWQDFRDWDNERIMETYISSPEIDKQNDLIPTEAIKSAMDFYMKYGIYSYKHDEIPIGRPLSYCVKDGKVKLKVGIYDKLPMHNKVWKEIQEHGKKGTSSIRGEALDKKVVCDEGTCHNLINELGLWSVSWVGDNPANKDAVVSFVSMAKYDDGEDPLIKQLKTVHNMLVQKYNGMARGKVGISGKFTLDDEVAAIREEEAAEQQERDVKQFEDQARRDEEERQSEEDEQMEEAAEEGLVPEEAGVQEATPAEEAETVTQEAEDTTVATMSSTAPQADKHYEGTEISAVQYIPQGKKSWNDALSGTIKQVNRAEDGTVLNYTIETADGLVTTVAAEYVRADPQAVADVDAIAREAHRDEVERQEEADAIATEEQAQADADAEAERTRGLPDDPRVETEVGQRIIEGPDNPQAEDPASKLQRELWKEYSEKYGDDKSKWSDEVLKEYNLKRLDNASTLLDEANLDFDTYEPRPEQPAIEEPTLPQYTKEEFEQALANNDIRLNPGNFYDYNVGIIIGDGVLYDTAFNEVTAQQVWPHYYDGLEYAYDGTGLFMDSSLGLYFDAVTDTYYDYYGDAWPGYEVRQYYDMGGSRYTGDLNQMRMSGARDVYGTGYAPPQAGMGGGSAPIEEDEPIEEPVEEAQSTIKEIDGQFCIINAKGKKGKCFKTKEEAEARLKELLGE